MRADVPDLIRLVAAGRIDLGQPISRRCRLDEADAVYRALDRGEVTGRAIVVVR